MSDVSTSAGDQERQDHAPTPYAPQNHCAESWTAAMFCAHMGSVVWCGLHPGTGRDHAGRVRTVPTVHVGRISVRIVTASAVELHVEQPGGAGLLSNPSRFESTESTVYATEHMAGGGRDAGHHRGADRSRATRGIAGRPFFVRYNFPTGASTHYSWTQLVHRTRRRWLGLLVPTLDLSFCISGQSTARLSSTSTWCQIPSAVHRCGHRTGGSS